MMTVDMQRLSAIPHASYVEGQSVHESFHYESQGSGNMHCSQVSFGTPLLPSPPIEYATNGVPDPSFNTWFLDLPQYVSKVSRSPSLDGCSDVHTPPPYTDSQAVYHLHGHSLPLAPTHIIRHQSWAPECDNWQRYSYENQNAWNSQPPLPSWNGEVGHATSLPPLAQYVPHFLETTTTSLPSTREYSMAVATDMREEAVESLSDSDSDSDSDSSDFDDEGSSSDCSQRKGNRSGTHKSHKDPAAVLKLGRWSMTVNTYTPPEQRHYVCPFVVRPDQAGRGCTKRFVRPEHLRRHVKTVHGTAREYVCKVSECHRPFSRGDNLRDHYWTHLSRGGRAGKNQKMSIAELKEILGPKEKKLIRRLKARLMRQKVKVKSRL